MLLKNYSSCETVSTILSICLARSMYDSFIRCNGDKPNVLFGFATGAIVLCQVDFSNNTVNTVKAFN